MVVVVVVVMLIKSYEGLRRGERENVGSVR